MPAPAASAVQQTRRDYGPAEVLAPLWTLQFYKSPFFIMYLMFVMVAAGGLMAVAQLALIAKDYQVDTVPVTILALTLPALTFALSIDRVLNGLCRPFFGWVSDHIGRENTMFIAFLIEGVGIYALLLLAGNPIWFVILSGLVFFAWGEIYSLFPGDLHRSLREEVRDYELRDALHRQRYGGAAGAFCQCAEIDDR